ncbi:hypothetical protein CXB51_029151 [Gossypium anomalum]|uniref:Dirigent protein n=1 Tax=Gossypium anomalum TaxID=47600 RepID=A0A8J6CR19_9ROSI|nr:hypothetical protein CXB51_029151 [Gossypium anomalum]
MQIIRQPNKTTTSFGTTFMVDDLLIEKLKPTSKLVRRAQGIYAFGSQSDFGLLMVMNFAFSEGIYNGSAISILGRNAVLDAVREMPIVGGSRIFQFARGYALTKTVWLNKNGDAIVEYNLTVVNL